MMREPEGVHELMVETGRERARPLRVHHDMRLLQARLCVDDARVAPRELVMDGGHRPALEIDGDLPLFRRTRNDREPGQPSEAPEGRGDPKVICRHALSAYRKIGRAS